MRWYISSPFLHPLLLVFYFFYTLCLVFCRWVGADRAVRISELVADVEREQPGLAAVFPADCAALGAVWLAVAERPHLCRLPRRPALQTRLLAVQWSQLG